MKFSARLLFVCILLIGSSCSHKRAEQSKEEFLSDLKHRTFRFFWDQIDSVTCQTDDRHPRVRFTSIASTGFGLSAYLVGVENGFISREEGAGRVLKTLQWLWNSKQGPEERDVTGYKGFYYHFLEYGTGYRYKNTELSTIDTGLLMAGILSCQSYFNGEDPAEQEIRNLADSLYRRVEWDWPMKGGASMSMGWNPEKGFIKATWDGYNEAMILLILALGSPTHPVPEEVWEEWCSTYVWDEFYGYEHVNFSPLFGHQYSHMYIDFRGIQDAYMRKKGIDYFENSVRATLSNRAYCIDNPKEFESYGRFQWGLTACDGPAYTKQLVNGDTIQFRRYSARGASVKRITDDGTIAPTATGGSIPFAPDSCIRTLMHMKKIHGDSLYQEYGFKDAYNMTYEHESGKQGWYAEDYIGIDQGGILIQLENYHSGLIWNLMKKNPYIVQGLKRAGFTGGWLEQAIITDVNH